jgi:hypothetical protein
VKARHVATGGCGLLEGYEEIREMRRERERERERVKVRGRALSWWPGVSTLWDRKG